MKKMLALIVTLALTLSVIALPVTADEKAASIVDEIEQIAKTLETLGENETETRRELLDRMDVLIKAAETAAVEEEEEEEDEPIPQMDTTIPGTRLEGVVLVVRFLNKVSFVENGSFSHPFTDVPEWGENYVGFAYEQGIVNGISDTEFGSNDLITLPEFTTMILRAMGYDDKQGDFYWATSHVLAAAMGIAVEPQNPDEFLRGDMLNILFSAMFARPKGAEEGQTFFALMLERERAATAVEVETDEVGE